MLLLLLLNSVQSFTVLPFCAQWMCLAALLAHPLSMVLPSNYPDCVALTVLDGNSSKCEHITSVRLQIDSDVGAAHAYQDISVVWSAG